MRVETAELAVPVGHRVGLDEALAAPTAPTRPILNRASLVCSSMISLSRKAGSM
jgi:hypothetical protein